MIKKESEEKCVNSRQVETTHLDDCGNGKKEQSDSQQHNILY